MSWTSGNALTYSTSQPCLSAWRHRAASVIKAVEVGPDGGLRVEAGSAGRPVHEQRVDERDKVSGRSPVLSAKGGEEFFGC